jgi:hypothetical protein
LQVKGCCPKFCDGELQYESISHAAGLFELTIHMGNRNAQAGVLMQLSKRHAKLIGKPVFHNLIEHIEVVWVVDDARRIRLAETNLALYRKCRVALNKGFVDWTLAAHCFSLKVMRRTETCSGQALCTFRVDGLMQVATDLLYM